MKVNVLEKSKEKLILEFDAECVESIREMIEKWKFKDEIELITATFTLFDGCKVGELGTSDGRNFYAIQPGKFLRGVN